MSRQALNQQKSADLRLSSPEEVTAPITGARQPE
jgi:hypothetical protein